MKKPHWIFISITAIFICILIGIFFGRRMVGINISVDNVKASITESQANANGQIDINTATADQLQLIDGIGPSIAQRIIDYRTNNGRFKNIEELKNVRGIGEKSFEKMKPYIKVTNN